MVFFIQCLQSWQIIIHWTRRYRRRKKGGLKTKLDRNTSVNRVLLESIYRFKDTWGRFSTSVDRCTIIPDNPQANDMSFKKYSWSLSTFRILHAMDRL